jgi:1,4-alpha-glucan branching enzyme
MPASQKHINESTPMGAQLGPGGATFRFWAPNAKAVHVAIRGPKAPDPRAYRPSEHDRLVPDGKGYWSGFFPGVKEGAQYRCWTVGDSGEGYKRDPRARELDLHEWPEVDCILRHPDHFPWHDADFRPPAFRDLILYQLHIGVYWARKDGKDIRKSRVSKFLDVVDRVEYLADLGVNSIQPLPVVEWQSTSSRGYNNTDFYSPEMDYALDPAELEPYRTRVNELLAKKGHEPFRTQDLDTQVDQLKALVDLCHVYGLAVVLDVVYNHAGPFDHDPDYSMRFFDRPHNNMWWDPDLYFQGGDGWAGGRIFDYASDEARQFLIDNAKMFLDEYHVDGFRFDEVSVIRDHGGTRFCRDLTDTLRYHKGNAILIAEYWNWDRASAVQPTSGGSDTLGFDAALHDGLRETVRGAVTAASGGRNAFVNMTAIGRAMLRPIAFPDSWRAVVHVENHDIVDGDRKPEDLKYRIPALADWNDRHGWPARSRSRVATGLVLTSPGIPFLFMGQEFLEDKNWHNDPSRDDLFLYWDGVLDEQGAIRPGPMGDFLRFTRALCDLRRRHPALRGEGVNPYFAHDLDRVVAVQRWVEGVGRDVIVVASLAEETRWGYPLPFPVGGYWHEVFNSDAFDSLPPGGGFNPNAAGNPWGVTADGPPRDGCPTSASVVIPANGLLVFARDRGDG